MPTSCATQPVGMFSLSSHVNVTNLPILSTTPCYSQPNNSYPLPPSTSGTNIFTSAAQHLPEFRTSNRQHRYFISINRCRPTKFSKIASWNVEGLTDVKLEELCLYMSEHGIAVLCIQETHKLGCPYYDYNGFLVILSGNENKERETAGTGFYYCTLGSQLCSQFHSTQQQAMQRESENPWWPIILGFSLCSSQL